MLSNTGNLSSARYYPGGRVRSLKTQAYFLTTEQLVCSYLMNKSSGILSGISDKDNSLKVIGYILNTLENTNIRKMAGPFSI